MGRYSWNIYTLEEKLKNLRSIFAKTTDRKELELLYKDINHLSDILYSYNIDLNDCEILGAYDNYILFKDTFSRLDFLIPDFKIFEESSKFIQVPKDTLKTTSLSKEDLLDLTHDFFKSLNRYFFGNFMKNFRERESHILFKQKEDDYGVTYYFSYLKEAFIEIGRIYTIEDFFTTTHEYMHATSFQINGDQVYDEEKQIFIEIESVLVELLAADFYLKMTGDENALLFKSLIHNRFVQTSSELDLNLKLMEMEKFQREEFPNKKALKIALKKVFYDGDINEILNCINKDPELYLTGYMFAICLYNLFQEDKDKALDLLKRKILLKNSSCEEYYSNIKRLGIIPNLGLETYEKSLKESMSLKRKKN